MPKYETVIHIITEGDDRLDAGDRAGEIIDSLKITDDIFLHCESTRLLKGPMRQAPVPLSEQCEQYLCRSEDAVIEYLAI